MQLTIQTGHQTHVLVTTRLANYSVLFEPDDDLITLMGLGLCEEFSTLQFPDPNERFAIAAYLVAKQETNVYGNQDA